MSSSYFNETHKLTQTTVKKDKFWDLSTTHEIEDTLYEKGYDTAMVVLRMDHTGTLHNALNIEREFIPIFVERFFQCRILVECMATGKGRAEIIFVCDTPGIMMLQAVRGIMRMKI